jgi:hypothetical protein
VRFPPAVLSLSGEQSTSRICKLKLISFRMAASVLDNSVSGQS